MKHGSYFIVIFLNAWLFGLSSYAQLPYWYRISDDDNFTAKEVYQVHQDKQGFVWIACNTGLYRYDGQSFVYYADTVFNTSSLSALSEDKQGRIWARNFRGQIFHTDNQTLHFFANWKDSIQPFPDITIDTLNNLWVTGDRTIYRYDIDSSKWSSYYFDKKLMPYRDFYRWINFFRLPNGRVFFYGTGPYIGYLSEEGIEVLPDTKQYFDVSQSHVIWRVFLYNNELYVFTTQNRVYRIVDQQIQFIADMSGYGWGNRSVLWINQVDSQRIAFCTQNGVFVFDARFQKTFDHPLLPNQRVSCAMSDSENNLWLTTLDNGVSVVPNLNMRVYNPNSSPLEEAGISALETDKHGNLYIATVSGNLWKRQPNNTFEKIFTPTSTFEIPFMTYNNVANELFFIQSTQSFLYNGTQIILTQKNTFSAPKDLRLYNQVALLPEANGIRVFYDAKNIPPVIKDINYQSDTFLLKVSGGFIDRYKHWSCDILRIGRKSRAAVLDTINGRIWGGYNDGVYWFKNNSGKEFKYKNQSLFANQIETSPNGWVWLATVRHGLLAVKDTNVVYSHFVKESIRCMHVGETFVWFATTTGLWRLNYHTGELHHLNKSDGLPPAEINSIAMLNNRLYVATLSGLVELSSDSVFVNQTPPRVFVERVAFWERDTVAQTEYDLPYNQNHITLYIKGLSFKSMGKYKLSYMLEGSDLRWTTVGANNNVIRYPLLPWGNYVFKAKAINEDGIESKDIVSIRFVIHPPFWRTWWFYLLFVLFAGILLWWYVHTQMQRLRARSQLEKQLKASEITALKAQMNPHFIFNALNSIQDLILQKDMRATNMYLGKFSDLLRLVLEASGQEEVSLQTEIRILTLYLDLEKLRFAEDFTFDINYNEVEANIEQVMLPAMIIQPYVENAVKHGLLHLQGKKHLNLTFEQKNNTIICTIHDNGIGRVRSQQINERRRQHHKPFATEATSKRIDLVNALAQNPIQLQITDLYDQGNATGTMVKIIFPVRWLSKTHTS